MKPLYLEAVLDFPLKDWSRIFGLVFFVCVCKMLNKHWL